MSTATELLNELKYKREHHPRVMSDIDSLLDKIEEYLESESLNDNARGEEDPTTAGQLDFGFVLSEN